METLKPLTVLEAMMLGAKAGGPGHFLVLCSPLPKPRKSETNYVPVMYEEQWQNMLKRIQQDTTRIYGVRKMRKVEQGIVARIREM